MIQRIEITSNTVFRIILIILGLLFIYFVRDILIILFTSIIIASAVEPFVKWAKKFKIPRTISVIFVYLLALGVIALIISLLIPPLSGQIRGLIREFPTIVTKLSSYFETVKNLADKYQIHSDPDIFLKNIGERLGQFSSSIFATTKGIISGFGAALMILVISFYLAIEEGGIIKFIKAITSSKHQIYVLDLFERSQHQIGRWLRGQLILALVVGVLVFLGLSALGVKYALVLALIAAVLEVIPYVGPILSAIPAIFLGFIQAPFTGILVIGLYVLIQQIENHFLQPKIMEKAVGLHPVTVITVLLIGAKIAGVVGMILAVPLASVISVFIGDLINFSTSTETKENNDEEITTP